MGEDGEGGNRVLSTLPLLLLHFLHPAADLVHRSELLIVASNNSEAFGKVEFGGSQPPNLFPLEAVRTEEIKFRENWLTDPRFNMVEIPFNSSEIYGYDTHQAPYIHVHGFIELYWAAPGLTGSY